MKNSFLLLALCGILLLSCNPRPYDVSREAVIDAPVEVVYTTVNNHQNRINWSPWEQRDENISISFEGPESGVGAIYRWSGNSDVGKGWIEILESEPNLRIFSRLMFEEPFEAESREKWEFSSEDGKTRVKWSTSGEFPGWMFWMGQDNMDNMMGPDLEKGLVGLAELCSAATTDVQDVDILEVEAQTCYYIEASMAFEEMTPAFFDESYQQILSYLGEDAGRISGPFFAVYHVWDEENERTELEVAIPCNSDKPGDGKVLRGTTYEGKTVMMQHLGDYESSGNTHYAIHAMIEQLNLQIAGSPWERYIVGPAQTANEDEWVTEIYYPVAAAQ